MKTESQLIAAFARRIRRNGTRLPAVVAGVGDDAAVWHGDPRGDVVATTDALVEGVHFERRWFTGRALGWRLAAVNLSDMAAMGARPRFALLSLAIPRGVSSRYIEDIQRGLVDHLARFGAGVVGGNVSSIRGPLVCDLTLVGSCARGRAWRRRARAGDAIVLAGELGAAAAGLELLRALRRTGPLVRAFRRPAHQLPVARALAAGRSVRGAIDVSDGLSTDLIRVCEAGRLGCDLDAGSLPIGRAVRAFCRSRGIDPVEWALHAGEDYALLLSVPAGRSDDVCRTIRRAGSRAAVAGRFTQHRGRYRVGVPGGRMVSFTARGWDHLRPVRSKV